MRVFTNTTFDGHWPVGSAAVVIADGPFSAVQLLEAKLADMGLPQSINIEDMVELSTEAESVSILVDGNY